MFFVSVESVFIMIDTHVHSRFSFDGQADVKDIANAALDRGLDKLIITEHYDVDAIAAGDYAPPDIDALLRELELVNSSHAGKLSAYLGIEIGQGYLAPDEISRLLKKYNFSFVISSVHNLEGKPDFWFYDFSEFSLDDISKMYKSYIGELTRAARLSGAHTLAHITYPLRYIYRDRKLDLDIEPFFDDYRRLFHIMTETGIALEINTSDCRRGYKISPTAELLKLYFDCGGSKLTVGSDAHAACDCGDFSLDKLDAHTAAILQSVISRDLSDVVILG